MSPVADDAPVIYVEELKDGNWLVFEDCKFLGIPNWIISTDSKKHIILAKRCQPGSLLFIDERKLPELIAFCQKVRERILKPAVA